MLWSAREAVDTDTPAAFAISSRVIGKAGSPGWTERLGATHKRLLVRQEPRCKRLGRQADSFPSWTREDPVDSPDRPDPGAKRASQQSVGGGPRRQDEDVAAGHSAAGWRQPVAASAAPPDYAVSIGSSRRRLQQDGLARRPRLLPGLVAVASLAQVAPDDPTAGQLSAVDRASAAVGPRPTPGASARAGREVS